MELEHYFGSLLDDPVIAARLPQQGRTTIVTLTICHHAKMTRGDVAALLAEMPERVEPNEVYRATCELLERSGR